jgi:hypothetical protein
MAGVPGADSKLKDLIDTCINGTTLKEQYDAILHDIVTQDV